MPIPTRTTSTRQRPEIKSTSQASKSAVSTTTGGSKSKGDENAHRKASTPTPAVANVRPSTRLTSNLASVPADSKGTKPQDSINVNKTQPSSRIAAPRTGPGSSLRPVERTRQANSTTGSKSAATTGHFRALPSNPTTTTRNLTSQTLKSKPRSVSQQSQASSLATRDDLPTKRSVAVAKDVKIVSPANFTQLHDEFIQLQHVHRTAASGLRQYQLSAEKVVSDKKNQLKKQQDLLLEHEARDNEALSIKGLNEWLAHDGSNLASHQIQLLSTTILELDKFRSGSDITLPLQQFEDWLAGAMTLLEDRTALASVSQERLFVVSLGHHWNQRMNSLLHSLHTIKSSLDGLGDAGTDSGVSVVLTQQRRFASVLIQEVETAIQVEKAIMRAESDFERRELDAVLSQMRDCSTEGHLVSTQRNGIWT